jgi:hypothetical protein
VNVKLIFFKYVLSIGKVVQRPLGSGGISLKKTVLPVYLRFSSFRYLVL